MNVSLLRHPLVLLALACCLSLPVFAQPVPVPELVEDEAPIWLAQLQGNDEGEWPEAIRRLGRLRDERALEPLLARADHANPMLRMQMLAALAKIGDPKALPVLVRGLNDDFAVVRQTAAAGLNGFNRQQISPHAAALVAAFADTNLGVQTQLVPVLCKLDDVRAGQALLPYLRDEKLSPDLRQQLHLWANFGSSPAKVDLFIAMLKNPGSPDRPHAAYRLGMLGDPRAIEPLLAALQDPDATVRQSAVGALARLPGPRDLAPLRRLLAVEDRGLRAEVIGALGASGDPAVLPTLVEASASDDKQARVFATEHLWRYADPAALAALLRLIADPENQVSWAAARALRSRRDPASIEPLTALYQKATANQRWPITAALSPLAGDPRVVDCLLDALSRAEPNRQQYYEIIGALQEGGPPAMDRVLARAQPDQPVEQRCTAFVAAQALGDARVVPLVLDAAAPNADPRLRNAPAWALTAIPRWDELRELQLTLPPAKARAFGWFGGRGTAGFDSLVEGSFTHPRIVDALIASLKTADWTERVTDRERDPRCLAIRMLGLLGDPRAADAVGTAVKAADPTLQDLGGEALARMGDGRLVDAWLEDVANAGNDERRGYTAMWRLSILRDPAVIPRLAEIACDHPTPGGRRMALIALGMLDDARAVEPMIRALVEANSPEVREFAGYGLGQLGDIRAFDTLLNGLNDPTEWARSAAAYALGQLGDVRAAPALIDAAQNRAAMNFLRRLGNGLTMLKKPYGYRAYGQAVQFADPTRRANACTELGETRDPRALPFIVPGLDDDQASVRAAAQRALGEIGGPRAARILVNMIDDPDPRHETTVIDALGRCRDPLATDALLDLLTRQDARVVTALGETGDPRAIPPLIAFYDAAPDDGWRRAAAMSLLKLGSTHGLETVLGELTLTPVRRYHALGLLLSAAKQPWPAAARGRIIDALAAALAHPDPRTRVQTARALLAFGDARGTAVLVQAFREGRRGLTWELAAAGMAESDPATPGVAETLMAELRTATGPRRLKVIEVLGDAATAHPGAPALAPAVEPLLAAVRGDDPRFQEYAARALGGIADARAVPDLITLCVTPASRPREQAVIALGRIPDPRQRAVPVLVRLLRIEESTAIRLAIVGALRALTGEDFGDNTARWEAWLNK